MTGTKSTKFDTAINELWSESKLNTLATYNAEVQRGIVHTPEYDARMKSLQSEFDKINPLEQKKVTAIWWLFWPKKRIAKYLAEKHK